MVVQCINESCGQWGYQCSTADDQFPDGKCAECGMVMTESTSYSRSAIKGVTRDNQGIPVFTRITPSQVVETKKETKQEHGHKAGCDHDPRDYATECKEEKLMYGSVQGY